MLLRWVLLPPGAHPTVAMVALLLLVVMLPVARLHEEAGRRAVVAMAAVIAGSQKSGEAGAE